MVHTCCVVGCTNRQNKEKKICLHRFPKWPIWRREAWAKALDRKPTGNQLVWEPKESSRVCNVHFVTGKPNDLQSHPDFIPSLNLNTGRKKWERKRNNKDQAIELESTVTQDIGSSNSIDPGGSANAVRAEIPEEDNELDEDKYAASSEPVHSGCNTTQLITDKDQPNINNNISTPPKSKDTILDMTPDPGGQFLQVNDSMNVRIKVEIESMACEDAEPAPSHDMNKINAEISHVSVKQEKIDDIDENIHSDNNHIDEDIHSDTEMNNEASGIDLTAIHGQSVLVKTKSTFEPGKICFVGATGCLSVTVGDESSGTILKAGLGSKEFRVIADILPPVRMLSAGAKVCVRLSPEHNTAFQQNTRNCSFKQAAVTRSLLKSGDNVFYEGQFMGWKEIEQPNMYVIRLSRREHIQQFGLHVLAPREDIRLLLPPWHEKLVVKTEQSQEELVAETGQLHEESAVKTDQSFEEMEVKIDQSLCDSSHSISDANACSSSDAFATLTETPKNDVVTNKNSISRNFDGRKWLRVMRLCSEMRRRNSRRIILGQRNSRRNGFSLRHYLRTNCTRNQTEQIDGSCIRTTRYDTSHAENNETTPSYVSHMLSSESSVSFNATDGASNNTLLALLDSDRTQNTNSRTDVASHRVIESSPVPIHLYKNVSNPMFRSIIRQKFTSKQLQPPQHSGNHTSSESDIDRNDRIDVRSALRRYLAEKQLKMSRNRPGSTTQILPGLLVNQKQQQKQQQKQHQQGQKQQRQEQQKHQLKEGGSRSCSQDLPESTVDGTTTNNDHSNI